MFSNSSKSFFDDVLHVFFSNLLTLLGSVISGLVVPSMLGVTNYGYYQMFALYSSYAAFLHFGFVDGILLKLSGKTFKSLNKRKLRTDSQIFILIEFVVTIIISLLSFISKNRVYYFLFTMAGFNIFLLNVSSYYQIISQSTLNFKGFSLRNTLQSIMNIVLTLSMWIFYKLGVMHHVTYRIYVLETLLVTLTLCCMCVYSYHNILFGKGDSIKCGILRAINYCKQGIYLTISYQVSNLILMVDNQIVSMGFRANVYGEYSFSFNIVGAISMILNAVATVLLPHLKRDTFHHMINTYHKMISLMMLLVYFALLGYFPLCILVKFILPEYIPAMAYLKIFFPELGIICSVTMITFNYYNALGRSKFYFYISLIVLAISTFIDALMYLLFKNPMLVAFGSLISTFIWYLLSEYYLIKWYHVLWHKNLIYMVLMISSFLISSLFNNSFLGLGIYLISYSFITYIMFNLFIKKYSKIVYSKICNKW